MSQEDQEMGSGSTTMLLEPTPTSHPGVDFPEDRSRFGDVSQGQESDSEAPSLKSAHKGRSKPLKD